MKKMKEKRSELGISQKRLSRLSGVSRFKISEYECDYCDLKPEDVQKIEEVFFKIEKKREVKDD